jgi:hypothetical protein
VFATFHGQESSCESTASAKGGAQFQNFMALYSSVDFALLIPLQAWAWAKGYFKVRAREIRLTLLHLSHVPDLNEMTHLNQRNH